MRKTVSVLVLAFLAVFVLGSFQTVSAAPFKVMKHGEHSYKKRGQKFKKS